MLIRLVYRFDSELIFTIQARSVTLIDQSILRVPTSLCAGS